MWLQFELRIGRFWFRKYWSTSHLIHRIKYRLNRQYRQEIDEIPF